MVLLALITMQMKAYMLLPYSHAGNPMCTHHAHFFSITDMERTVSYPDNGSSGVYTIAYQIS